MLALVTAALAGPMYVPCDLPQSRVAVAHLDSVLAQAREDHLAGLELRPPQPMPAGGFLWIAVVSTNIDAADLKRYTLVAVDAAGTEVVRATADGWRVPRFAYDDEPVWQDSLGVDIPVAVAYPLSVYVIDQAALARCSWLVQSNGLETLQEGAPQPPPTPRPAPPDPCRIETAVATMTDVYINGERISVVGRPAWTALQASLQSCGRDEAADLLFRWRKNRRWTNGLCATIYGCPIGLFPGIAAGQRREEMEQALLGTSE